MIYWRYDYEKDTEKNLKRDGTRIREVLERRC